MLKRQFDPAPWTIWQTFSGLLWTLTPYTAYLLLIYFSSSSAAHQPKPVPISPRLDFIFAIAAVLYAIVAEGVFILAPIHFAKQTSAGDRQSIMRSLGFRGFNVRRVLPWLILLLLAIFLVNYLYGLLITALHLHLQTNDQLVLERGKVAPISIYATLLGAAVIAPPCEEIFFRSFAFIGFLREMPVWIAVVLSAFLFAIVHADLASFIVLFFIGLALAFLRWYSNSIWPGIILHMLNNTVSGIIIVLALNHVIKI